MSSHRTFTENSEAESWAQQHYGDLLRSSQDSAVFKVIYSYTGSWYKHLNRAMRDGDLDEEDRAEVRLLSEILTRYQLNENIVVYRVTHRRNLRQNFDGHRLTKGVVLSDPAFLSTTLVQHSIEQFRREQRCGYLLKIHLPKGMPGAYVSLPVEGDFLHEQEFLLPPNTKLRIDKIHYLTYPRQIDCTALLD